MQLPSQAPLFHAAQSLRYERQALISAYETAHQCRLVVMVDSLFPDTITLFEDLLFDADPEQPLHLLIDSLGGDGEIAIRLLRSILSRCSELTVIVPDQAKSAATLLALGAHHILLGPAGDLGPIDPQFRLGTSKDLISAREIIAAVDHAAQAIEAKPSTYPLHVSLLPDVTALMVEQARSALKRTEDLLLAALESNQGRPPAEIQQLTTSLRPSLAGDRTHTAFFGIREAKEAHLPVADIDWKSEQWQIIWRLWAKYHQLDQRVYESARVSHVFDFLDDEDEAP